MKTEFLQNLKVSDQALPKEIIDAILAENGRDIEAAKKPFADYETIKNQLATAQETIKGFESQDIDGIKQAAKDWEKKYNDALAAHQQEMADREFDGVLKDAILAAKGRSDKAIRALLDVDTLKASKNQAVDIKTALETLKKDNGFLFESDQNPPPPYSFNSGVHQQQPAPTGDFKFAFTGIRPQESGK